MDTKKADIALFQRNGYLLLEDDELSALAKSLRDAIVDLMLARAGRLGLKMNDSDQSLDSIYNMLYETDTRVSGGVYDAIRELPEFFDLINAKSIKDFVSRFFSWKKIHLPFGLCQFRIDRPEDKKYFFDWHQDYVFNIISKSAVTFWVPLSDVTFESGPIQVLPGSHNELHPVTGATEYEPGKNGNAASHLTFKLNQPNLDFLEKNSVSIPVSAGQFIMFHSHVLHRSGFNRSSKSSRWTAIFRMGDFFDAELMDRNFFCARPNKPNTMAGFSSIHPDFFIG